MNEWISVKDRLPEAETEVLVYHGSAYNQVCNVYVYLGGNEWMDGYCNKGYTKDEDITHWMPLPASPTEKENKHESN